MQRSLRAQDGAGVSLALGLINLPLLSLIQSLPLLCNCFHLVLREDGVLTFHVINLQQISSFLRPGTPSTLCFSQLLQVTQFLEYRTVAKNMPSRALTLTISPTQGLLPLPAPSPPLPVPNTPL